MTGGWAVSHSGGRGQSGRSRKLWQAWEQEDERPGGVTHACTGITFNLPAANCICWSQRGCLFPLRCSEPSALQKTLSLKGRLLTMTRSDTITQRELFFPLNETRTETKMSCVSKLEVGFMFTCLFFCLNEYNYILFIHSAERAFIFISDIKWICGKPERVTHIINEHENTHPDAAVTVFHHPSVTHSVLGSR